MVESYVCVFVYKRVCVYVCVCVTDEWKLCLVELLCVLLLLSAIGGVTRFPHRCLWGAGMRGVVWGSIAVCGPHSRVVSGGFGDVGEESRGWIVCVCFP